MRSTLLPLAVVALACGCNHITTKVPGVVDLRSDASGAPIDSGKVEGARSGFDSILSGDGTSTTGGNVKINEKRYWVISLISVGDNDVAPEVSTATGKGALRNVHIGEEITFLDGAERACVSVIPLVNLLGLVLPPWDVYIDGTKVKTGDASEPPSPAAPPAPPAPGT